MPLISYTRSIPDAPNDPSVDQPSMKINTNSTDDILNVDHYSFNQNEGGNHKQVTFANKNVPGAQTDPVSVLYTNSGTASSVADLFFRNQNGIFCPNIIKAAGVFTTVVATGAVPIDMGINVSSIAYNSGTQAITINLTAGAVNGTTVIVFINGNTITPGWTFAANTLTLAVVAPIAGRKISFAILQV